jgi:hypothetical protein
MCSLDASGGGGLGGGSPLLRRSGDSLRESRRFFPAFLGNRRFPPPPRPPPPEAACVPAWTLPLVGFGSVCTQVNPRGESRGHCECAHAFHPRAIANTRTYDQRERCAPRLEHAVWLVATCSSDGRATHTGSFGGWGSWAVGGTFGSEEKPERIDRIRAANLRSGVGEGTHRPRAPAPEASSALLATYTEGGCLRINPSWAVDATRRPSREKMLPRTRPRAPCAAGLSIT